MKWILLFLTLSLSQGFKSLKGRAFCITRVRSTASNERIERTVYVTDLYRVLGVSPNSTKQELKKAYYEISAKYHPDRDDSEEALAIFRNASYAYKILGKDQATRNEYDAKFKTLQYIGDVEEYISVLSEVGNDVIKPFAMGVALPLLNYTFQSLRSFAVPIIRDTAETTTAVLKEAARSTSTTTDLDATAGERLTSAVDGAGDLLTRTSIAVRNKRYEQSVRRLNENVLITQSSIARNKKGLKGTYESQRNLTERLAGLEESGVQLREMLELCDNEVDGQRARADASLSAMVERKTTADKQTVAINAKETQLTSTTQSVSIVADEVRALESRLGDARSRLQSLEEEQSTLATSFDSDRVTLEHTVGVLKVSTELWAEQKRVLDDAAERRRKIDGKLQKIAEEIDITESSIQRQQSYSEVVEKKVIEQNQKLVLLRQKAAEVGAAWEQFGRKEGIEVDLERVIEQQWKREEERQQDKERKREEDERARRSEYMDINTDMADADKPPFSTPNSNPIQAGWVTFLEGDEDKCFDFEYEKKKFLDQEDQKTRFYREDKAAKK